MFAAMPLTAQTQRYLVAPRDGATTQQLRGVAANADAEAAMRVRSFRSINAFAADLTDEQAAELRRSDDLIVEPIVERHALGIDGTAPLAPFALPLTQEVPWGVTAIRAASVWPVTRGEGINVVVADTGIDAEHPDLKNVYAGGYNFFKPAEAPVDKHRHGTHVSGTIAAADNTYGVVGVAPGVRLWSVKVLDDDAVGSNESIVSAFDWTIQKKKELGGRWVMNLSLGSNLPSEIEELAVARAISSGIIVVASAGNRSIDEVKYPARYRGVIAVGAVDAAGKRAYFSSYGLGLTIMAPGTEVRSTIVKGIKDTLSLATADASFAAWSVIGSPYATVTAPVVDCGLGQPHEIPADIAGKIALVRRGKLKFREMARNIKEAGAAALIIETYPDDVTGAGGWTLYPAEPSPEWESYPFPLTIGVRYTVGEELLAQNLPVTIEYTTEQYGTMNGTSMAAPHVTGTVAMLLALDPTLSSAQVDYILRHTARDIYDAGWDYETAWGIVDALAAAHYVAPQRFNVPPPPPFQSGRRRSVR